MALVKLPCLSADATGSVGKALTFVPNAPLTIVRKHQPARPKFSYPLVDKLTLFNIISHSVSAISQQAYSKPSLNLFFKAILSVIPHNTNWHPYSISKLSKFFRSLSGFYSYIALFDIEGAWTTYAALLPLYDLLPPEYPVIVRKCKQFIVQATLCSLLKLSNTEYELPPHEPTLWGEDEIIEFYQSQINS